MIGLTAQCTPKLTRTLHPPPIKTPVKIPLRSISQLTTFAPIGPMTINVNGTITTKDTSGTITNFNVSGTFLSKNLYKKEYAQIVIMIGKTVEL